MDDLYRRALRWEAVERLPISLTYPLPSSSPFKLFPHHEVFDDPEKMLFNELVHAFETSIVCHNEVGDDLPWTIRANFGTGVIASVFDAKIEQVEDNPPWTRPYESLDAFQQVFDCDPLDFSRGWCPRVIDRYQFYHAALAGYPRLRQAVRRVIPDLQGPMDTAELLRGSEIYADLIEMNDLDCLYAIARERKIALIRVDVPENELLSGRVMQRFPSGGVLRHKAASVEDAARIMASYRKSCAMKTVAQARLPRRRKPA